MNSIESKTNRSNLSPTIKVGVPALAVLLLAAAFSARADGNDNRAPVVPAALAVPDGNKVQFHAYAVGVQIYVCKNISSTDTPKYAWVFTAPEAVLYDSEGNQVGIHYAGPTWESESGSKVVGARLAGATVDPTAIPWLLLAAKSSEGPGIFADISYVQRVNTAGGLAPTTDCDADHLGQVARVPYTAEYFFFRAK